MNKLHHILIGIDFTPPSQAALREGIRWAALDGASVTALHIMEENLAAQLQAALGTNQAFVLKQAGDRLKAFLSGIGESAKDVRAQVEIGHPYLTLVSACQRYHADLLVLGSHGSKHTSEQVGVIAAKCVRKAPVDVLLVKEGYMGPFQRVLACVDFSETSARAVQFAAHVAGHDSSKLDALFVNRSSTALAVDYGCLPKPVESSPSEENATMWQNSLKEFVDALIETDKDLGLHCEVREEFNVRDAVLQYVSESQSGLVVLGTRGKTDLRALIMGTTAERIVQSARCSVLALKPEDMLNRDG